jgi:Membrane carboxypeptidase/penicillin-binding protein
MIFGFLFDLFVGLIIAVCIGAAVILGQYVGDLPDHRQLQEYRPKIPTEISDQNGRTIASLYTEYREFTPIEEIPKLVQDAFLSAEDKNFYEHPGLDPAGILRALLTT